MLRILGLFAVAVLAVLSALPASALETGDPNENRTTQVTRTPRESTGSKEKDPKDSDNSERRTGPALRGEFEFTLVSETGSDQMLVIRKEATSKSAAESTVRFIGIESTIEDITGMTYRGSFPVTKMGECEGSILFNGSRTYYYAACASGKYVHFVVGSNKEDVIAAMRDMQSGYEPYPVGYLLDLS